MLIEGYHGTDYLIAQKIAQDSFVFKYNEEHWLGNGVYFYLDFSLAEWWTSKPSKKFGADVYKPAIIKCSLSIDEDEVIDLRKLKDFLEFSKIYKNDFLPEVFSGRIACHGVNGNSIFNTKKLRCTYCDYLKTQYEIRAIIGTFHLPEQPYLIEDYGDGFKRFDISYTETQICVFDQNIITDKKIIPLGGRNYVEEEEYIT